MKICYSNPTFLMKRPIARIAEALSDDNEVTVLTPKKLFKGRDSSLHHSDVEGVEIVDYSCLDLPGQSEWPIPSPGFFFKTLGVLRDNDVVHMWVPVYISHTWLAVLKKLFFPGTDLILTMDTIPGYSFSMGGVIDFLFKVYYKTLGRIVFSACDKISLYGESLKKYAEKAGVPLEKVEITPTGVDVDVKKKDKDVKEEFDVEGKIVIFAGLMNDRKGVDTLIETAEKFKDEDVTFLLLGDGPKRGKFENMAEDKGLEGQVTFTGFRKDIHDFYHAADVFFLPSRGEGLPGVVMEAIAYGVPVVSSDIPCTHDLVEDGRTGFLCPVESIDCYEQKIRELLEDEEKTEKVVEEAKKKIKEEYSWEENIKKFGRLYGEER